MSRIYVEFAGLELIGTNCKSMSSTIDEIKSDLKNTIRGLDWDVRYADNINSTANQIVRKLDQYSDALAAYQRFIADARKDYVALDEYDKLDLTADAQSKSSFADILTEAITIAKSNATKAVWNVMTPGTGLLYITSGLAVGKTPQIFKDPSRTPSSSTYKYGRGYELADDHQGITAWLGKAGAEAQNEWGYANVNAYVGKVESKVKSEFFQFSLEKKADEDGDKPSFDFTVADVGVDFTAALFATDAHAGVGNDMLGLDLDGEMGLGVLKLGAGGKVSFDEEGLNVNAEAKALVTAAEGKVSGTFNILGLEIKGTAKGYAGALGVEAKAGIEDNKLVLEGGAAALLGGSVGVEIGFNDEGWDNFVDFVTFWD